MSFLQSYDLVDPAGGNALELAQRLPISAFAQDPVTGDLANPPRIIYGVEAYAQRLRTRLHFLRGEWFLDRREGMPYFRDVLTKDPQLQVVDSLFRRAIMGTPLTLELLNFRLDYDRANRLLIIEGFEVRIGPPVLLLSTTSTEAFLVLP